MVNKLAEEEPQSVSRKTLELGSTLWNASKWWRPQCTSLWEKAAGVVLEPSLSWRDNPFSRASLSRGENSVLTDFGIHEVPGKCTIVSWVQVEQKAMLLTLLCDSFFAFYTILKYWQIRSLVTYFYLICLSLETSVSFSWRKQPRVNIGLGVSVLSFH